MRLDRPSTAQVYEEALYNTAMLSINAAQQHEVWYRYTASKTRLSLTQEENALDSF